MLYCFIFYHLIDTVNISFFNVHSVTSVNQSLKYINHQNIKASVYSVSWSEIEILKYRNENRNIMLLLLFV